MLRRSATLAIALILLPCVAQPQSNPNDADLLMQRLAQGGGSAAVQVTLGALPPGWAVSVPLPNAVPILGSVNNTSLHSVTIYYNPVDASSAYDAYAQQLAADGFIHEYGGVPQGGFQSSSPRGFRSTYLCHGDRFISVTTPPNTTRDLRVTVDQASSIPCPPPGAQLAAFRSPVPMLTQPQGTIMNVLTGGTSYSGSAQTLLSSATIGGKTRADAITPWFLTELKQGGWQITSTAGGSDAAVAAFRFDKGATHWRGSLSIFRIDASTFSAILNASGTAGGSKNSGADNTITVFAHPRAPALARIPARASKAQAPALLELLRRLAMQPGEIGTRISVYVGRVPPGSNHVYLPTTAPVGSTLSVRQNTNVKLFALYYELSNTQLQNYVTQLQRRGWAAHAMPTGEMGGFSPLSIGGLATFCNPRAPSISMEAVPNSSDVTILFANLPRGAPDVCKAMTAEPAARFGFNRRSPLPELKAPPNVLMSTGTPGTGIAGGASGAKLVTTMPLAQLIDAFTSQMTQAGWQAFSTSINDLVGSRSFRFKDATGQRWQAVLTIYRSDARPNEYYTFIDLTNLTADQFP